MEIGLIIVSVVMFYVILYFVMKAAVRDGIAEARHIGDLPDHATDGGNGINQVICQKCGKEYDIDYPKCPYCKHRD